MHSTPHQRDSRNESAICVCKLYRLYTTLLATPVLKQSLRRLFRSRRLFSNSLEEKKLSACTCWKLYTLKLTGSQSFKTSDETENVFNSVDQFFRKTNNSDWSKLWLFWKNDEKLRMRIVSLHQKFHVLNILSAEAC